MHKCSLLASAAYASYRWNFATFSTVMLDIIERGVPVGVPIGGLKINQGFVFLGVNFSFLFCFALV